MDYLKIKKWLKVYDGSSFGYGSSYGYGDGDGYGYGYGSGSGSGYGSGYGYGSGDGYGYGYGYGDGDGDGYEINGDYVHLIDGVPTIIKSIKGLIAKGYIVNKDLTLQETYITKDAGSKYFAHGKTISEAIQQLENKIFDDVDVEEKIEIFLNKFKLDKEYKAELFFDWHGKLTNSCLQGRESFVKNNDIDLNELMTVENFIELTEQEFGREVIKELKNRMQVSK